MSQSDCCPILLLSELYPPAVGGSAVLFENVYSRVSTPVTVLTDTRFPGTANGHGLPRERRTLQTPHWGLVQPQGLAHHISAARTVRGLARRLGPETIVHCGRILPEGVAARFAAMGGGPPVVCWAHGEDLATAMSSRELTWVTRWVLRGTAAMFANSENTKAFLGQFGVQPDKVTVVHPGVDCARFHPSVDGRPIRRRHGLEDRFVLLTVGRLQARKGHDVAIRAVAKLARDIPNLSYIIVGAGGEQSRLDDLIRELGVGDRVHFIGQISDEELPAYFAASDVFLLANRIEQGDFEGFGIVFLEAAATGKPVIGGANGGVTEAVADGRNGLLVAAEHVDAVVAAIAQLVASPELRAQFGQEGRRRAEQMFSWEAAAASVERVHHALASR